MKDELTVTIKRVNEQYVAFLHSRLYDSTYSVCFPDTISGALALHAFAVMIERHYGRPVKFQQSNLPVGIRCKALLDTIAETVKPITLGMRLAG